MAFTGHRPPLACASGFILSGASRHLQSPLDFSPSRPRGRDAFHGVAFPLRGTSQRPQRAGIPGPDPHPSSAFHTPTTSSTPPTLRVCFTPLPRPGFTFRGFPSHEAGNISSISRALSSLASCRCRRFPVGATSRRLALRALLLVRVRDFRDGGWPPPKSDPLLVFSLLQVLRRRTVETPSRLLPLMTLGHDPSSRPVSWSPACSDASPGWPLSRLPTCSRFPACRIDDSR